MKRLALTLLIALGSLPGLWGTPAEAQQSIRARVVTACGTLASGTTYVAGQDQPATQDTTGKLCDQGGGGGGGGTSSNFGSAFPTAGTAAGFTDGTNMRPANVTNFTGTSYAVDGVLVQGTGLLSATNGLYSNLLQGNAVLAAGNPLFAQLTTGAAVIGSLVANQSVNNAQVNGVNILTGAGASGTGAQRVTISQDTTTIAGSAPGTAGSASPNVVSVQGIASGTPQNVDPDSVVDGVAFTATSTSIQTFGVQSTVGYGAMDFQFSSAGATASFTVQESTDGGTTYAVIPLVNLGSGTAIPSISGQTVATGTIWRAILGGTNIRFNQTAIASGTTTVIGTLKRNPSFTFNNMQVSQSTAGLLNATVAQGTASNLNADIVGNVASGGSDSGNPVKIGCVFNATQPTVTNTQRVDCQATSRGAQIVATGVDGFNVTPVAAGATSTQANSTVTTHLTFQAALASNTSRKGCLITNTSADQELIYFGATGSATSSNALPLLSGQGISCATPQIVLTDNVAITSKTTDGAAYIVVSQ